MIRRDLAEVLQIEYDSYPNDFWSEKDLIEHLRERNCIGMTLEDGEKVVGYMVYLLHKTKLEIIRLAIHKDYRRKKLGKSLIEKLESKLSARRRKKLTIDVDEYNLPAQLFLQYCGLLCFESKNGLYKFEKQVID